MKNISWKNPFEEASAFVRQKADMPSRYLAEMTWVFNRAMVWLDEDDGVKKGIICYSNNGILHLSGTKQVSQWLTDPTNSFTNTEQYQSCFKKNQEKSIDFVILPGFEFQINQHPGVEFEVSSATGSWLFAVHIFGRSGPALFSSEWKNGSGKLIIDLQKEFRKNGFKTNYAKFNFVIFLRTDTQLYKGDISFSLRLVGDSAIIPCLPLIRTIESVGKEGVTVYSIVVDENARLLKSDKVSVIVTSENQKIKAYNIDNSGVWQAKFMKFLEGEHIVRLDAKWNNCDKIVSSFLNISIKKGEFISYEPEKHSLMFQDKSIGPISGSFISNVAYPLLKKAPKNLQIHGFKDYLKYNRLKKKISYHMWIGLSESDMEIYFTFLERCGWRIVRRWQHWNIFERLDVGGRISPHGAENFASTLRCGGKHNIFVLMDLTHYPYGFGCAPYSQYVEQGYGDEPFFARVLNEKTRETTMKELYKQWISPEMMRFLKKYLTHFFTLFSESREILGVTMNGEGDIHNVVYADNGDKWLKEMHAFIHKSDKNHLIVLEHPGNTGWYWYKNYRSLDPRDHMKYPLAGLAGYRTYGLGRRHRYDVRLSVEINMIQCSNKSYIGECCWPGTLEDKNSGPQTEDFRLRVRDNLYIGLIHQMPIILSWDEWLTEDEAFIFSIIRSQVNFGSLRKMQAPVAIRLNIPDSNADEDTRFAKMEEYIDRLVKFEEVFRNIPLEYVYVWKDEPIPKGVLKEIIPTKDSLQDIKFISEAGIIPEEIRKYIPLKISDNYSTHYLWSIDKKILLAYIYNISNQGLGCTEGGRGPLEINRRRKLCRLEITIQNFSIGKWSYKLYDLDIKKLVKDERFQGNKHILFPETSHDYFLLVKENKKEMM